MADIEIDKKEAYTLAFADKSEGFTIYLDATENDSGYFTSQAVLEYEGSVYNEILHNSNSHEDYLKGIKKSFRASIKWLDLNGIDLNDIDPDPRLLDHSFVREYIEAMEIDWT